jgi:hypothetical protein
MGATLTLALVPFDEPYTVASFLFAYNLAIAFGDIVNDGLMVE